MLNFGGITHINENTYDKRPAGFNFTLAGSVPASMLGWRVATTSDVMGGRAHRDANGVLIAPEGRRWETVADIIAAAKMAGDVKLCTADGCACRKLFSAEEVTK